MQVFAEMMDGGRENEDVMMKLIAGGEEVDDGSQFLNDSGKGIEEPDRRDGSGEEMEDLYQRDGSGEGMEVEDEGSSVGTLTTKSGEVY